MQNVKLMGFCIVSLQVSADENLKLLNLAVGRKKSVYWLKPEGRMEHTTNKPFTDIHVEDVFLSQAF